MQAFEEVRGAGDRQKWHRAPVKPNDNCKKLFLLITDNYEKWKILDPPGPSHWDVGRQDRWPESRRCSSRRVQCPLPWTPILWWHTRTLLQQRLVRRVGKGFPREIRKCIIRVKFRITKRVKSQRTDDPPNPGWFHPKTEYPSAIGVPAIPIS